MNWEDFKLVLNRLPPRLIERLKLSFDEDKLTYGYGETEYSLTREDFSSQINPNLEFSSDEIGLIGRHRLELFARVGDRETTIGLHEVVSETEAAAVPPLGIVDHAPAPLLDHSGQNVGEFAAADA